MPYFFAQFASVIKDAVDGQDGKLAKRYTIETLVFIAVASLQYSYQRIAFHCPHKHHLEFSLFVLFSPATLFYCIAVLMEKELNEQITGIFRGGCTHGSRKRKLIRHKWKSLAYSILAKYFRCSVAAFTWIVLTLLRKQILICAIIGPEETSFKSKLNTTYHKLVVKTGAQSQIYGITCLVVPVLIATVFTTLRKCFKQPIDKLPCLETYTTYEAKQAQQEFVQLMKNAAEENAQRKVEMIMEAVRNEKGCSEDDDVTFGVIMETRERLMHVYPILKDKSDFFIQRNIEKAWQEEIEVFNNVVQHEKECKSMPLDNEYPLSVIKPKNV